MKKNIIIYVCFFIGLFLLSFIQIIECDGIWCYGFSYNIANGLVPYRDFNMVIGPLYSLLFSIPIYLFGNYIVFFNLFHIMIYSLMFTCVYKKIGLNSIFLLLIFSICVTVFGYNQFCLTLLMFILIILDSKSKYKQLMIGIMIGIILMIKHNIGLFLLLPYIYDNRKKLLNILSILIPIIPTLLYLIINNAFNSYIDFCYLGIGNFLDNFYFDLYFFIIYIFFVFPLIKIYLKSKDIKILYILFFQILIFPIFEPGHAIPALIPVIYYLLYSKCLNRFIIIKWFSILGVISTFASNIPQATIMLKNNYLRYTLINKSWIVYLNEYSEYLNNKKDGKIYLLIDDAYLLKIYGNSPCGFYDLINKGNHGSNEEKYLKNIDEECNDKKCYFILDFRFFNNFKGQRNKIFKNYVIKNAKYLETLPSGDRVYVNK